MTPNLGIVVAEKCEKLKNKTNINCHPIQSLKIGEKETHFGNEDVERPIEAVRVQHLGTVLADLLKSSEASLGHRWVIRVQQVTQAGQQVRPVVQISLELSGSFKLITSLFTLCSCHLKKKGIYFCL